MGSLLFDHLLSHSRCLLSCTHVHGDIHELNNRFCKLWLKGTCGIQSLVRAQFAIRWPASISWSPRTQTSPISWTAWQRKCEDWRGRSGTRWSGAQLRLSRFQGHHQCSPRDLHCQCPREVWFLHLLSYKPCQVDWLLKHLYRWKGVEECRVASLWKRSCKRRKSQ